MPRVSVLMPAYNSEKYIATAIESILNQTFSDFEFIIINDGSTDNTAKIVRQYARRDPRIKFIDNKKNRGLIAVLNMGLDLCTGEYIARMDSDDVSRPQRFKLQVEYMDAHPECGVVSAWIQKFGPTVHGTEIFKYTPKLKLLDLLIYGPQMAHPAAMIRASVLRDNNIYYDPAYPHAEDYALWASIAQFAELHNLQTVLLDYRWHDTNVSIVHRDIQHDSAHRIQRDLLSKYLSKSTDVQKFIDMTHETNQHAWLFWILPIIRRKQYALKKTKYYLFEKIPLIKIQNNGVYLFEFIKIGVIK